MLTPITHPFNQTIGKSSITPETKKLIVGTFPPHEVVMDNNPRMRFYYGSQDNKFWDLFRKATNTAFEFSPESILSCLKSLRFGILDIVEQCYRKENKLSSDNDLSIICQTDFPAIIQQCNCRDFYTTSNYVSTLLKKQLQPLTLLNNPRVNDADGFSYETLSLSFFKDGPVYEIRIFTLYSPSDNGLRGIQKGLNNRYKDNEIKPDTYAYRDSQYRALLNIP